MEIIITKGRKDDRLVIRRADGSVAEARVVHKGAVPHDAAHFFVERGLGLVRGFWGMVAAGHHPDDLAALAKSAGHASASRAGIPDPVIVELLQAERLVECFEADLWGGGGDDATLLDLAARSCGSSHVPLPAIGRGAIGAVRAAIADFARDWSAMSEGHDTRLEWKD